jgi:replicative DNA helicase
MADPMTQAEAIALGRHLAARGRSVFPIAIAWDEGKQKTNKRPLTRRGHLDATCDVEELARRFNGVTLRRGEEIGVGIWPGAARRFVVDVDVRPDVDGHDTMAALEADHGKLPEHPVTLTPSGGTHHWFARSADIHVGNAHGLGDGIDLRGDDGWVVAPGTRTSWGEWALDEATTVPIPEAPPWLLERVTATNGSSWGGGRWQPLERGALHPADLAALQALEALGGHDPYVGGDGAVMITRPGKVAGASASVGHIGPGVVKVFTPNWAPLEDGKVYDADALARLSDSTSARAGESSVGSVGDWEPPAPLSGPAKLPTFPVEALPGWVRDHVQAVAHFTQTPVDLAATVALAGLATAIAGKVRIQVRGPWIEPMNGFFVSSLPPGSRKSAVFKAMTAPLYEAEKMLVESFEPEILEAETLIKITTSEAKRKAEEAAKAEEVAERKRLEEEATTISQALAQLVEDAQPRPRLIADDITPEAAAQLLAAQRGRLGVLSAEGGIFQILAGRYSPGMANLDLFLKGHAGDALRVDRKNASPLIIDEATLSLGLTVQPEVLRQIADMPGFRGRGLLARILFSLPENTVGWRQVGVEPPEPELANRYRVTLANLAADIYRWADVATLELSPEAAKVLLDAEKGLEPKLRPGGDFAHIVDWASKLIGAVARIAGLLHVAEHLGGSDIPVQPETVNCALRIGGYFAEHSRAAFEQMGADPTVEDARYVLDWIRRTGRSDFTRRDAHRGCQRFKKVSDLDPALEVLEDHGYIRRRADPAPTVGRPPAPTYDVNPITT